MKKFLLKNPKKIHDWAEEGSVWQFLRGRDGCFIVVMIALCLLLSCGVVMAMELGTRNTAERRADKREKLEAVAKEYNMLSEVTRRELSPLISESPHYHVDENGTIRVRTQAEDNDRRNRASEAMCVIWLGAWAILSITLTIPWCRSLKGKYYMADLPYERISGKFLLLLLWVVWPFLLVSYLRMRVQKEYLSTL